MTTLPTKMIRLLSKCCIKSPIPTPSADEATATVVGPRRPGRVARGDEVTATGWLPLSAPREPPDAVLHDGRHSQAPCPLLRVRRRPTHGVQPSSAAVCVAM